MKVTEIEKASENKKASMTVCCLIKLTYFFFSSFVLDGRWCRRLVKLTSPLFCVFLTDPIQQMHREQTHWCCCEYLLSVHAEIKGVNYTQNSTEYGS